ncbi:hypothetical protein ABZ876_32200 [Streptomyces sp. NPDC046931]|uniref:hypothetical protein n=1 Tax=Streptomyces sp. NPDC046931 TaxID=3154806 RepID=UPI0033E3269C
MSNDKVYLPGEAVPESGLYECETACGHSWSTDVQGQRFPATPADCSGSGWKLATKTPVGQ